ncbi:GRIM-19 [Xylariaceae sp. FL0804]|nr:GRIM-19 [Xylariaceae sp. FL0804]
MPQDMPPVGGYGPVQYKGKLNGRTIRHGRRRGCVGRSASSGAASALVALLFDEFRAEPAADDWRNLPAPGLRPSTLIVGMVGIMVYGWYKLGVGLKEQKELAREKMWARVHLIPVLQAEEDRDLVRRHLADQAREKQLLGENFKVYHSDRFVRPTFAATPTHVTK